MAVDTNKPLHKSWLFWLVIIIPLILASLAAYFIQDDLNLQWAWSKKGFDFFYEHFKIPIAIIGISIPLSGFVAALHRSNEASKQIRQSTQQNNFSNYFRHKEEFSKLIKRLEDTHKIVFANVSELYKELFPRNGILESSYKCEQNSQPFSLWLDKYSEICAILDNSPDKQLPEGFYAELGRFSCDIGFEPARDCGDLVRVKFDEHNENPWYIRYSDDKELMYFLIIHSVLIELALFCDAEWMKLPNFKTRP